MDHILKRASLTIGSRTNVSYSQVQDFAHLLPDAVAQSVSGVASNILKAAHGMTGAVTGVAPFAFFCVASMNNDVVGFMVGLLDSDVYTERKYARGALIYVRPSARDTSAYHDMMTAFEQWARTQGAQEVRTVLLSAQNPRVRLRSSATGIGKAVR
ncbi:hypothetical protein CBA19CS22_39640 [Caballeronia novacaledonica]|uniref:Uncharacterized protein n=1 Tax=Caballeronia novacaledonica TaxID=1544861 RepID=A0ACB5R6Y5_9BURK|nr:hypothetical protein CBA19CS22_39640 [Caballeronia novacaledonica]